MYHAIFSSSSLAYENQESAGHESKYELQQVNVILVQSGVIE